MIVSERTMERFWEKVEKTDTCWLWTASIHTAGYGQFGYEGKTYRAHRVAYELVVGPIPAGLQLDHLCRVRRCVNPDHLEPVTNQENSRRGDAGIHMREKSKLIDACPKGHPYTEENTRMKQGARNCRACELAWCRRRPRTAVCPFCNEERHSTSMARHIRAMHAEATR